MPTQYEIALKIVQEGNGAKQVQDQLLDSAKAAQYIADNAGKADKAIAAFNATIGKMPTGQLKQLEGDLQKMIADAGKAGLAIDGMAKHLQSVQSQMAERSGSESMWGKFKSGLVDATAQIPGLSQGLSLLSNPITLVAGGLGLLATKLTGIATQGIAFNTTLEQAQIGIAGVLRQFHPKDYASFQDAMTASGAAIEELKKQALESPASFLQLVQGFQMTAGAAASAGLSVKQHVDLVTNMSQALAGLGIPAEQLSQEMRALFTGDIDMNAQAAKMLGITREQVLQMQQQGKFYEFMTGKLAAFKEAGKFAADSMKVLTSNFGDAMEQMSGAVTKNFFDGQTMQDVTRGATLVATTVKEAFTDAATPAEEAFDSLGKTVGAAAMSAATQTAEAAQKAKKDLEEWEKAMRAIEKAAQDVRHAMMEADDAKDDLAIAQLKQQEQAELLKAQQDRATPDQVAAIQTKYANQTAALQDQQKARRAGVTVQDAVAETQAAQREYDTGEKSVERPQRAMESARNRMQSGRDQIQAGPYSGFTDSEGKRFNIAPDTASADDEKNGVVKYTVAAAATGAFIEQVKKAHAETQKTLDDYRALGYSDKDSAINQQLKVELARLSAQKQVLEELSAQLAEVNNANKDYADAQAKLADAKKEWDVQRSPAQAKLRAAQAKELAASTAQDKVAAEAQAGQTQRQREEAAAQAAATLKRIQDEATAREELLRQQLAALDKDALGQAEYRKQRDALTHKLREDEDSKTSAEAALGPVQSPAAAADQAAKVTTQRAADDRKTALADDAEDFQARITKAAENGNQARAAIVKEEMELEAKARDLRSKDILTSDGEVQRYIASHKRLLEIRLQELELEAKAQALETTAPAEAAQARAELAALQVSNAREKNRLTASITANGYGAEGFMDAGQQRQYVETQTRNPSAPPLGRNDIADGTAEGMTRAAGALGRSVAQGLQAASAGGGGGPITRGLGDTNKSAVDVANERTRKGNQVGDDIRRQMDVDRETSDRQRNQQPGMYNPATGELNPVYGPEQSKGLRDLPNVDQQQPGVSTPTPFTARDSSGTAVGTGVGGPNGFAAPGSFKVPEGEHAAAAKVTEAVQALSQANEATFAELLAALKDAKAIAQQAKNQVAEARTSIV